MNILGFDTAASSCSAALWCDGRVSARRGEPMTRGHAEALMPMILAVLDDAGARFDDLDAIAVTRGPGSFTGLRVGLATAQGLSLARDLPVTGVTTLEAAAFGVCRAREAPPNGACNIVAAIDTRRADVYVQVFSPAMRPLSEPAALMADQIAATLPSGPFVLAGDAARRVADALGSRSADLRAPPGPPGPDAVSVAALAAERWSRDGVAPREGHVAPLYIHPPRATLPANQGRLRP